LWAEATTEDIAAHWTGALAAALDEIARFAFPARTDV
jgi:hypothetical protein